MLILQTKKVGQQYKRTRALQGSRNAESPPRQNIHVENMPPRRSVLIEDVPRDYIPAKEHPPHVSPSKWIQVPISSSNLFGVLAVGSHTSLFLFHFSIKKSCKQPIDGLSSLQQVNIAMKLEMAKAVLSKIH